MKLSTRPDVARAEALRASANATIERLSTVDQKRFPSDALVDYYGALHKYLEAYAYENGVRFRGDGAHYELIEYVAEERKLPLHEKRFLQELREQRNRVAYEGEEVTYAFLSSRKNDIERLIKKVRKTRQLTSA